MTRLEPPHRAATPADADALARLVNLAGEGLPAYLWERLTEAGETVWDVGRRRALRAEGGFSYRNAIVREADGEIAAGLIGYPLPDAPDTVGHDDLPPMFVPLQALEDMVPGTWYINVLAVFPKHQGRGYGTDLLSVAETLAAEARCPGLSLIVSDGNPGAVRLYERSGYAQVASRPMVKEAWRNPGQRWVLMTRRF